MERTDLSTRDFGSSFASVDSVDDEVVSLVIPPMIALYASAGGENEREGLTPSRVELSPSLFLAKPPLSPTRMGLPSSPELVRESVVITPSREASLRQKTRRGSFTASDGSSSSRAVTPKVSASLTAIIQQAAEGVFWASKTKDQASLTASVDEMGRRVFDFVQNRMGGIKEPAAICGLGARITAQVIQIVAHYRVAETVSAEFAAEIETFTSNIIAELTREKEHTPPRSVTPPSAAGGRSALEKKVPEKKVIFDKSFKDPDMRAAVKERFWELENIAIADTKKPKPIAHGRGLLELKGFTNPVLRVYFAYKDSSIYVLEHGEKQIQPKEIHEALNKLKDLSVEIANTKAEGKRSD